MVCRFEKCEQEITDGTKVATAFIKNWKVRKVYICLEYDKIRWIFQACRCAGSAKKWCGDCTHKESTEEAGGSISSEKKFGNSVEVKRSEDCEGNHPQSPIQVACTLIQKGMERGGGGMQSWFNWTHSWCANQDKLVRWESLCICWWCWVCPSCMNIRQTPWCLVSDTLNVCLFVGDVVSVLLICSQAPDTLGRN